MSAGKWKMNGEPIILNGDGSLLNGQHRLLACVKSGKPFPSLIVKGIDVSAFDTMDSGKARTLADAMSAEKIPNSTAAAATVRSLVAWEQKGSPDTRYLNELHLVKRDFIDRYYRDAPSIQKGVLIATRLRNKMTVSKSAMAFSYVVFSGYSEELADDFFKGLIEGRGLAKRDPCYVARERLSKIGIKDTYSMTSTEQSACLFKAFKAFMNNVEIGPRQLSWRRFGPAAEKFPGLV
tara:strand:+ start:1110 stop:1817 length:708 start_codon:yes stop_codon:yes gene_type:complete